MTTATTIWRVLPTSSTLLLFALSSMTILVLPGPTMLYVVSRTLEHGRAAGLLSVLGVEVGALAHVAAAAAGLSTVLASSASAMTGLQLAGAAYLLHLGIGRLRSACEWDDQPGGARDGRTLFWQGVLVDVLNPKTAIFFLAFLPQFVAPDHGAVALQFAALGLCFVALATLSDGACALAAGVLHRRLSGTAASQRRLNRIAGASLLALAFATGLPSAF